MPRLFLKRSGPRGWLLASLAIPGVLVGTASIVDLDTPPAVAEEASEAEELSIVVVTRPAPSTGGREIVLPGSFEPYEQALLHARVTGYLSRVHVDIGDSVKKNATLAELHIPEMRAELARSEADLAAAEAESRRARAAARVALITSNRLSELQAGEPLAVTQQDVDIAVAEAEVAGARADIAAAQVNVATARLSHLQAMMSYATIRAPFDGVIVRRFVDPGSLVVAGSDGGSPLFRVVTSNQLRLVVSIPEAAVPFVKPGVPASISVDALPGERFTAELTRIAGALANDTRTMRAEIDMHSRGGHLRPGMYASVRLSLGSNSDAFSLPASSVHRERDATYVWTVSGGVVAKTAIQIVDDNGEQVIVASGVDLKTLVVLSAPGDLAEGQAVRTENIGAAQ